MKSFKEFCGDLGELAFSFQGPKRSFNLVAGKRGATQAKAMGGAAPKPRKPAAGAKASPGAQTGAQQTHTAPQQTHVAPQQTTTQQQHTNTQQQSDSSSSGDAKKKNGSGIGGILKNFARQQAAKNFGLAGQVAAHAVLGPGPKGSSGGTKTSGTKTSSTKPKAAPKAMKAGKTSKPKGAPKANPYPGAKR